MPPAWIPPPPESRVQGPAIGLLIAGGLGALFWLLRLVLTGVIFGILGIATTTDPQMQNDPDAALAMLLMGVATVAISIVPVVMNLVICWGAWKLMRLESYTWSMTAAILALIPCQPPCCLLTIPFGIWAIVVMQEPAVRDRMTTPKDLSQVFD